MAKREILESIEAHIARGNELMERNTEAFEANRREHGDLRQFIQEITRRIEASTRATVDELLAGRHVLFGMQQELRDLHEESRAQRSAIWTLIDELRSHGLGGRGSSA